jgi:arylsulfatase A-like enzyme
MCALFVVFAAGAAAPTARQAPASSATPPNIVLVMSDDLGYGDLSSYGARDIKTPNIDSIGRAGVRLTDFYANGVLCSPTRAGLISGRWQQRYVIETALGGEGSRGLKVTGHSLPQVLKNHGYATGLVGKWHLGGTPELSPMAHGFEYFFGHLAGGIDYYHHTAGPKNQPDLWENGAKITQEGYMTDLITERSIAFIERSAAAKRPFFVDVAYNAPHWPYQPPGRPSKAPGTSAQQLPQDENTSTRADYAAMVEAADAGVGRILATLDRLKLTNNTIVIFTNDNGGEWLSSNGELRNRKWTVWEGGIRVPAMIKWPGRIPSGRVSRQVGITMDLTASLLAASGAPVAADARYEGINLFPILEGKAPEVERTLYWRVTQNRNQRAIRSGDWKLVVDGTHVMVFNLRNDRAEREDLTRTRQDIARRLRPMLAAWERDVDAEALVNDPEAAKQQQTGAGRGAAAPGRGGAGADGGGRRGGGAAPAAPGAGGQEK